MFYMNKTAIKLCKWRYIIHVSDIKSDILVPNIVRCHQNACLLLSILKNGLSELLDFRTKLLDLIGMYFNSHVTIIYQVKKM